MLKIEILKDFTDYAIALFTLIIAMAASLIAFLQWKTMEKQAEQATKLEEIKLKHDLFDKRYQLLESIKSFLGSILTTGDVSRDEEIKFLVGTKPALFLFGDDIVEYVNQIFIDASKLHALNAMFDKSDTDEQAEKILVLKNSLTDRLKSIDQEFAKYMQIK